MNHNFAIETHAAERYVLGELTSRERDEYEEHMFNCTACAEEVKCAFELGEGLRMAFEEQPGLGRYVPEPRPSFWRQLRYPVAQCASVAALLAISFNVYFIAASHRAQPFEAAHKIFTLHGQSRSSLTPVEGHKKEPLVLQLVLPDNSQGPYQATVLTEANVKEFSSNLPAINQPVVIIPVDSLQPGKYSISVKTLDGKGEVTQFPFELKIQD